MLAISAIDNVEKIMPKMMIRYIQMVPAEPPFVSGISSPIIDKHHPLPRRREYPKIERNRKLRRSSCCLFMRCMSCWSSAVPPLASLRSSMMSVVSVACPTAFISYARWSVDSKEPACLKVGRDAIFGERWLSYGLSKGEEEMMKAEESKINGK